MSNKTLVTIFARCFRLISKLSVAMDDNFFADLLNQGSENLLRCYLNFLKYEGTAEGFSRVAQSDMLQHKDVAQCCQSLIYQIKNLLEAVSILKHLQLTESTTPLLLERDLLLLESLVLNDLRSGKIPHIKEGKPFQKSEKNSLNILPIPDNFGHVHKQIAQFVVSRERTQNTEVFARFSGIAKRTLKRKLSELVGASVIKRVANGKKVFYSVFTKVEVF